VETGLWSETELRDAAKLILQGATRPGASQAIPALDSP
jgi:hypothetical protein